MIRGLTRRIAGCALLASALASGARAQILSESFNDVAALPAAGWVFVNQSPVPAAPPLLWFQGNPAVFPAQSGAPGQYVATNFLGTASPLGDVFQWMITPVIPLSGGEVVRFYTRSELQGVPFADNLQVILGVGSSTALANFSNVMFELGPVLGGPYPTAWQRYDVVVPSVPGMSSGRIAFRYVAEAGNNASFVGIDTLSVNVGGVDTDLDGVTDSIDNCPTVANADQADGGIVPTVEAVPDGVGNACDNCVNAENPIVPGGATAFLAANPWATLTGGQRDDDHDGYGNVCDGDFNQSLTTTAADTAQYKSALGKAKASDTCGTPTSRPCAIFDVNAANSTESSTGGISAGDTARYKLLLGSAPGPRCAACTGTGSVSLPCSAGSAGTCN